MKIRDLSTSDAINAALKELENTPIWIERLKWFCIVCFLIISICIFILAIHSPEPHIPRKVRAEQTIYKHDEAGKIIETMKYSTWIDDPNDVERK